MFERDVCIIQYTNPKPDEQNMSYIQNFFRVGRLLNPGGMGKDKLTT